MKNRKIPGITKLLIAISVFIISGAWTCGPRFEFRFQDPHLPVEESADDLVGRMALEEKIGQMMNAAPAMERLQVPPRGMYIKRIQSCPIYRIDQWGNENETKS